MAKKKKKRRDPNKYKKTIINRLIEENQKEIAKGYYTQRFGSVPKLTKKNINLATSAFKRDIKGIMMNNPELTAKELYIKTLRSTKFTPSSEIQVENFLNEIKKTFFTTQKRTYRKGTEKEYTIDVVVPMFTKRNIRWDPEAQLYMITMGENAGKHIKMVHRPNEDPSYTWEII